MTLNQIADLLTDGSRGGAPEPSLLPWLTRHIAPPGLPEAAAAGAGTVVAAQNRWPVIADAIAAIIAAREHSPGPLAEIISILPPVAAHLDAESRAHINWPAASPDAAGYAALGDDTASRRDIIQQPWAGISQPPWPEILARRPATRPLAGLTSLRWMSSPAALLPDVGPETDQEAAYLLPFHDGQQTQWQALEAIEAALADNQHWYAAALLARAAPYLSDRDRMRAAISRLPAPWSAHMALLTSRPTAPWESDEDELAASHPAIATLSALAADVNAAGLARTCLRVMRRIRKMHRLTAPWESVRAGADGQAASSQVYQLPRDALRLLGPSTFQPARNLNVWITREGEQAPVPPRPLALHASYVVRCNIGTPDDRSLVGGEDAVFPGQLLPAEPLNLQVVLFLDGHTVAAGPLPLPRTGNSPQIELALPRTPEPRVAYGDIAVYYGSAVVLMYGLSIPFGTSGPGPAAVLRYRLSRSLTDLAKLQDRTVSVTVGEQHAAQPTSALYVNGLAFTPFGLTCQTNQLNGIAHLVRNKMFDMCFKQQGQISRYQDTGRRRYVKPAGDLTRDLAELAQLGNEIYSHMFGGLDDVWLTDCLHDEAAARDRPPVLQAITASGRPASIPWAALYNLPVESRPQDYEPCPSIAQFGPGGNGAEPPACCPYERTHRDGDRWKSNQLCPWGFLGLSTIIEQPPGIRTRDLETRVRLHSGLPSILVGYDTKLDRAERRDHLLALQNEHGENIINPFVTSCDDALVSLGPDDMDVVYFYCHILDDPDRPDQHIPAIQFGDRRITQQDIYARSRSAWPVAHWAERHPLVILNGCSSVEKGPGSLANLVDAFVETAGASGVIGTEIAIEQGIGGWAMELFLSALRDRPVGAALRSMRWEMFRYGNLMGLAYTAYCLAQLALPGVQENAWF